jgi:hypothetical protein
LFVVLLIQAPPSQELEPPANPARFTHPIVELLGKPGTMSVLELQYHESEIMRRAMAELRTEGIPSLPVHDSLIVPLSRLEEGETALSAAFCAQVEIITRKPTLIYPLIKLKAA